MKTRLVVEWTRQTLRVAVARARGARWHLAALHSRPVGQQDELAAALRELVKAVKIRPTEVIGVIPREQVITRVITFPSEEAAELHQMVELYTRAQLPYPREQALVEYAVLEQRAGFSTVALVACQRDTADRHLTLLRAAGLSPTTLTVSSWGVAGWFDQLTPAEPIPSPTLIINVDDARSDLVLLADGRLLFSRSVGQGAQDWRPFGEDVVELLALEVERSRATIRKELAGVEFASVLLTGCGDLARWREPLAQRLGMPVTVSESVRPLGPAAAAAATVLSPVVAGGLATGRAPMLDLSPAEVRSDVRHREQVRQLATVGVLLAAVLLAGSGWLSLRLARHQRLAARLTQALAQAEPAAAVVRERLRTAALVESLMEDRRRLLAALSGIFQQTPPSVALDAVTVERSRASIVLRGDADSTQAVLEYIKQLEGLEGVRGVELKYSTRRTTPSGERTAFELLLHQAPEAGKIS